MAETEAIHMWLPSELKQRLKLMAEREQRSMTKTIERALRAYLGKREEGGYRGGDG